jgi:D-3-phosphoglycerate dehydrogenase
MTVTSERPRVVVFDPLTSIAPTWSYDVERQLLAEHGVELVVPSTPEEADEAVRDADVAIVAAIRGMNRADIERLTNSVGLLCYSIGMNQVDAEAAADHGIPVGNVPFCVDEVSDQALTLLLAAERRLVPFVQMVDAGDWNFSASPLRGKVHRLKGRTLGIIGTGRIGSEIARKAAAFGYRMLGYDPYVESMRNGLQKVSLETLLAESDAIVLAPSLNPTSRNIINRDTLAQVKRGVTFVNIARGGLVDEAALAEAIRDGRVGYAALDVRADEPPKPDNDPLTGLPNLIVTPHIAGLSIEAQEGLHVMAAEAALVMLRAGGRLPAVEATAAGAAS